MPLMWPWAGAQQGLARVPRGTLHPRATAQHVKFKTRFYFLQEQRGTFGLKWKV